MANASLRRSELIFILYNSDRLLRKEIEKLVHKGLVDENSYVVAFYFSLK
jgi:hypothetical protein